MFNGPNADNLVNATLLSLMVNTALFIIVSLTRHSKPLERIQAGVFMSTGDGRSTQWRGGKTRVSVGDLKAVLARYLGEERMQRSFKTHERQIGFALVDAQPPTWGWCNFPSSCWRAPIGSLRRGSSSRYSCSGWKSPPPKPRGCSTKPPNAAV